MNRRVRISRPWRAVLIGHLVVNLPILLAVGFVVALFSLSVSRLLFILLAISTVLFVVVWGILATRRWRLWLENLPIDDKRDAHRLAMCTGLEWRRSSAAVKRGR